MDTLVGVFFKVETFFKVKINLRLQVKYKTQIWARQETLFSNSGQHIDKSQCSEI
jgi:hypothetical protein